MSKILAVLHSWRPLEVYVGATILWVLLFLNVIEAFKYKIKYFLGIDSSIIYRLIRGLGDDHLGNSEASMLFWIIALIYAALIFIKAPQISNWIWNDSHVGIRRYHP
jgi:hypothetical protein